MFLNSPKNNPEIHLYPHVQGGHSHDKLLVQGHATISHNAIKSYCTVGESHLFNSFENLTALLRYNLGSTNLTKLSKPEGVCRSELCH